MRRTFAEAVLEIAVTDPSLVVCVGDISHGILTPFATNFPDRYYNIGICEPTIVNMASGLSKVGLNPVIHTIAPFLIERSFEQLKLDFEYEKQSVNLVSVGSGFDYSQLGCTHHCYDDLALLRQLPSSCLFVPGTAEEFAALFRRNYSSPGIKYFRLSEFANRQSWSLNGDVVQVRSGRDVSIVALGTRLEAALEAADSVAPSISCDVFYVNQLKPVSLSVLRESVSRTRRLVTVEEHSVVGGLFDVCMSHLAGLAFNYSSLGVKEFIHIYGTHEDLCAVAGVSSQDIAEAARALLGDEETR